MNSEMTVLDVCMAEFAFNLIKLAKEMSRCQVYKFQLKYCIARTDMDGQIGLKLAMSILNILLQELMFISIISRCYQQP